MLYDYINDETKDIVQREFPMDGDIPKVIVVGRRTYRRDYGVGRIPAIHIPLHWNDHKFSFNRGPSGKKHIF